MSIVGDMLRAMDVIPDKPTVEIVLGSAAVTHWQIVVNAARHYKITDRNLLAVLHDPCTQFHIWSANAERDTESDAEKKARARRRKELAELRSINRTAKGK